ncbi:hypothetical protein LOTGIDRAFT_157404, partial [Lottia gigantea]
MDELFAIYEAVYPYFPQDHSHDDSHMTIRKGDRIKVSIPNSKFDLSEQDWLNGSNLASGSRGFFPASYVKYIETQGNQQARPPRPHRWVESYVSRPVLCHHCGDYIWSLRDKIKECEGCGKCYHNICFSLIGNSQCTTYDGLTKPEVYLHPVSVENWTVKNVIEWMAALNLYRYIETFREANICGEQLREMDEEKLREMGIKDEFHQKSILVCIDELCGQNTESQPYAARLPPVISIDMEASGCSEHRFAEYNFSSMQRCHLCDKFLYGLVHQGLQCRECGLCCHRFCSTSQPTECNVPKLERIRRPSFSHNSVFGQDLPDEVNKSQKDAPDVLHVFVQEIEQWCQEHSTEALSVYRISCKAEEINQVKKIFCQEGDTSKVNLSSFSVHCVAGALKKYLRELPNPVLPVEMYNMFIHTAKSKSSTLKSLSDLIEELPPAHKSTLQFLMAHFCRLWKIQNESGVSDGLDKLSHVFCHILLRPPWERIIEIVDNTKLHIDIFEELMRNGNWGEDIPPIPTSVPPTLPP